MRNFKLLVLAFSLLLISGCVSVAKFDNAEYSSIVTLRYTASSSKPLCDSPRVISAVVELHSQSKLLNLYAADLPDNEDSVALYKKVDEQIETMYQAYIKGMQNKSLPSPSYCKLKLQQIEDDLAVIQPAVAKRKR